MFERTKRGWENTMIRRFWKLQIIIALSLLGVSAIGPSQAEITRVSTLASLEHGDYVNGGLLLGRFLNVSLSADGRYIAFQSIVGNLVSGDTNNEVDIFIKDLQTGMLQRASVSATGEPGNGRSRFPSLSADARYVAFESSASNLVPGDTNDTWDIFVKDLQTGMLQRASVSEDGAQGDGISLEASISADGRYVAFVSSARNLTPGFYINPAIFVKDLQTGVIQRASISATGEYGNRDSYNASISAVWRFVAFVSSASNLVPGDNNRKES
ncbi:MAG: hypothetical protein KY468_13480, partial [Armatimonadetes bacterium]|nr:hypothetical protein [Armatimonadota bacterium]